MVSLREEDLKRNFPSGAPADLLDVITSSNVVEGWAAWQERYSLRDVEIYRLIPALYFRLQEEGVEAGTYLRGVVRHCYAAGAIQQQEALKLMGRLGAAGIETLALKGLALSLHLGYAPRHMSDIDLLIPVERVDDAVDIVVGAGWVPDFGVRAEDVKKAPDVAHGWGFRQGPLQFDLHWHSTHQDQSWSFDSLIWETAERRGRFLVPSKTLLMFQILLHGFRQFSQSLVWTADLYSLLKAPGEIEWEQLAELAQKRRLLVPFRVLLTALSRYTSVPPVPDRRRVTMAEVEEHRGLTTRAPTLREAQAVRFMADYRKNHEGDLPPLYVPSSSSRMMGSTPIK